MSEVGRSGFTSLQQRPAAHADFDRVARLYRWAEYLALGTLLQRTRVALLGSLRGSRHALLFGDGDGRFVSELLRVNRDLHATAVDTSRKMLDLLQANVARAGESASPRLRTVQTAAMDYWVPANTDLVVSHFFLDCLSQSEVEGLVARVAAAVKPGTLWLNSDFAAPPGRVLSVLARLYIRTLYFVFRMLTGLRVTRLPDPQTALRQNSFRCIQRVELAHGLLYSELWERTGLALHNPAPRADIHTSMQPESQVPDLESRAESRTDDPLPDPEPAVPSLPAPDPAFFHGNESEDASHSETTTVTPATDR